MRFWMNGTADLASSELDDFTRRFTRAKWLFPFFGLLMATDAIGKPSYWEWTISGAVGMGCLGYLSIRNFERHPQSVRALFFMMDGMALSLGLLLPSMIEELARVHAKNYWLYRDYFYVYGAVFAAIFLYVVLMKRWRTKEAKEQMAMLSAYAERGTITAPELFEVLTHAKGAKEALRNSSPQKLASIIGPIAVAFVGVTAWGGGDYMLYLCFLLSVSISPILIGISVRRRIELHRYLGRRDVIISGLTPEPRVMTRWKNRIVENYRLLGKFAKFGVYAELVVFLAIGALVNMTENTPWGIVVTFGVWLCGFILILMDDKEADVRLRVGQLGWILVHAPLIFVVIHFLISIFK